jgi:hypothetical protein
MGSRPPPRSSVACRHSALGGPRWRRSAVSLRLRGRTCKSGYARHNRCEVPCRPKSSDARTWASPVGRYCLKLRLIREEPALGLQCEQVKGAVDVAAPSCYRRHEAGWCSLRTARAIAERVLVTTHLDQVGDAFTGPRTPFRIRWVGHDHACGAERARRRGCLRLVMKTPDVRQSR